MDEEWREIIHLLPSFQGQSRLVLEYVEKFGVTPLRLKSKKILRLLKEVSHLFSSGRFKYRKREYEVSYAGIVEALVVVNNKHFEQPLENHNYLKRVMISIAEREAKERSIRLEQELRKKEALIRSGGREKEISAEEWKKRRGIESLADVVGRCREETSKEGRDGTGRSDQRNGRETG